MSDALLRFENVTKSYGDFTVFSDISLEVHEKEVVSIIGSSGSGKTTLLRCINLLEPFEAGKIILDGQEIGYHDVNGKRKRVPEKVIAQQRSMTGMVFQQFNLFPHMTAKKNVMLGLTHTKKMPKAEAEALAEKWLTAVGLGDKMDNLPSELSGGQQQRVAIARAVAMNPKILLFDEATSALDPATTESILSLIKDINRRLGITAIIITHEMSVIEKICNQVAIISHGRIAETGSVEEVFFHPQTEEARQLVIPEALQDMPHSRLYRIIFNGRSSFEPVISNLVLECGAPVNIMFADTRDIGGTAFGQMVLQLPDNEEVVRRILAYADSKGLMLEEMKNV